MLIHLTVYDNICKLRDELPISNEDLPFLALDERNTLAEFLTVHTEVRTVAHLLEADRELATSCTPSLLGELLESLSMMADEMTQNSVSHYAQIDQWDHTFGSEDVLCSELSVPATPSMARHCKDRDDARSAIFGKAHAKQLAWKL